MKLSPKLNNYSSEIPEEIKFSLKALANDIRLGILVGLLKHGKMSFSQMKKDFELDSGNLVRHLELLQNGNLVVNYYGKGNKKIFSYYQATDIADRLLKSIFEALLQQNPESSLVEHDSDELLKLAKHQSAPHEILADLVKLAEKVYHSPSLRDSFPQISK